MQTKMLFSQHYLETRLPGHTEWADDPRHLLEEIRVLWRKARAYGARWNEAQTEAEFVRPVLNLLGWSYTVQTKATYGGQVTRPDYALFDSLAAKAEANRYLGQDHPFYSRVRAIAEAKYWGRPLSQKDASERNTWKRESNPSYQMVSYLVGTRVPWGILTNGRTWRLYSREVSSTASEFYEVDLGLIMDFLPDEASPSAEQLDQFRRWWLFFRRDSFVPDVQGRSFLARVHEGSGAYARRISDKLKELVFEEVVPEIAGGFVAYRHRQMGISAESEESLSLIYAATLSLLYKLLFLLYAEARGLLPVGNPGYDEQSLSTLAREAADRIDRNLPLSDAAYATRHYEALLALFHRIDRGDASLGIPRYDGGLFNPATPENRFLEEHRLSDRVVTRAVDTLVRDAGEPVDYAYISVRNLGAIYEGLLENRLRVLDAAAGRVELVDDRGERKASGSYYTPDYIVEYIVEHTLDPLLDERAAAFEAAMDRAAELRRRLAHASEREANRTMRRQLEEAEDRAREAFLGIKVCDPAMGSGHFLVNAVDRLTDGIIQRMQVYHDSHRDVPWERNPVQQLIERVRGEILAEMERQGLSVDPARLDDTALLTRLVMKRCIYGVDLNRLAVELAKLSLWLHSFTVGAPLSFLDHHLRWGNSLIGSDVRTVEAAMRDTQAGIFESIGNVRQFSLFAGPFAALLTLTVTMIEVVERADTTLADVRQSAEEFARFQEHLVPFKQVLDLWVSRAFGNKAADDLLTVHGDQVLPALQGQVPVTDEHRAAIDNARRLWQEKRFFHWDLEFPEVFVDLHRGDWAANPGFDAVVGNPPYVRQEQLSPNKRWFRQAFAVYHGVADLYAYFYEQGVRLLRHGGFLGMITSNKFLRAGYGQPLRAFLAGEAELQELVDFGHAPIFQDADTFPCIALLQKPDPGRQEGADVRVCPFPREALGTVELASYVDENAYGVPLARLGGEPWNLERPEVRALMDKIRQAGIALREFAGTAPYRGIVTGLNEAFLIDKAARDRLIAADPRSAEVIHPYLRGQDIKRWMPEWAELWMLFIRRGADIDAYPAIRSHLAQFREQLEPRPANWTGTRWPGRKPGAYKWYEIQDSIDYWELFSTPKILYQEIQFHSRFSLDEDGYLTNNKVFLIPSADLWLLAVLNSPLIWWYNWRYLPHMKDEALNPQGEMMEQLPVALPSDAIREAVEPLVERLTTLTKARQAAADQLADWLRVEFDVVGVGARPGGLAALDEDAFLREASRRRPKSLARISPGDIGSLRSAYRSHVQPIRAGLAEKRRLEHRLAALVNEAYGLTAVDVELMWRTAPPRMPGVAPHVADWEPAGSTGGELEGTQP